MHNPRDSDEDRLVVGRKRSASESACVSRASSRLRLASSEEDSESASDSSDILESDAAFSKHQHGWSCSVCTFRHNEVGNISRTSCEMCGTVNVSLSSRQDSSIKSSESSMRSTSSLHQVASSCSQPSTFCPLLKTDIQVVFTGKTVISVYFLSVFTPLL